MQVWFDLGDQYLKQENESTQYIFQENVLNETSFQLRVILTHVKTLG